MNNEEVKIVIEKLVYGGYGMARYADKIYMVNNVYPGEFVSVIPTRTNKNLVFADLKEILQPSHQRISSKCKHFPECGGCQWLDYDYKSQLKSKTGIVKEQLERIGKLDSSLVNDIIESDLIWGYRNRMEYAFQKNNKLKLGLNIANSNNVLDIYSCPISPNLFDNIRNKFRELVNKLNIEIYDKKTKKGILKHLVIRRSFSKNQTMVIIVTNTEYLPYEEEIKQFFQQNFQPYSLIHLMNSSDSVVLRGPYKTLLGEGVLNEEFDDFKFQIPPTAFFQNNYNVTQKLLRHILEYFKNNTQKDDTMLDLYSGVGLFSIYFSPLFKHIESVETSKVSVKAAISNSHINFIKNVNFILASSKPYLMKNSDKRFDYVILDPPRKGLEKKEIQLLSSMAKKGIIYVSCDPSTFARDLNIFTKNGFTLKSVQPFDMFPHSYHIENVGILEKN
ncbi:23S rRNA (uracil(1939)-C(5))-methyltransferase RlmD [Petrotoga sp. 9T1HF07.CasAA.8.2]|uniref:23S rRNA (uracil(1939)-C(5))-methyltransferase RlmD n=1 Tax=Petrotoga sp. 9T1HF07.CasAA.8.2 TaxID=1434329 RepID=UPI000EFA46D2|nr:23S rRNA (uracil(1939)-C(5))-methyltransferase RlmD [Petrotoga sp. 9T1HF07.CasAA.8.2]